MHCPNCHSKDIKKNGSTHYGKQNHKCKSCGRQFVAGSTHLIGAETGELIIRALSERVSLRGICRIMGVSLTWLLDFAVKEWGKAPEDLGAALPIKPSGEPGKKLQVIGFQIDELWSFVGDKRTKVWVWVVYYPPLRQVVAFEMGGRDSATFSRLWRKLPKCWRGHCDFETDHWPVYGEHIPGERHYPDKGLTYWIESFFARVRARCSRLVRRNRAFSKKIGNHKAAIAFFFWKSNQEMAALHL